jgi:hypothetical protein
MPTGWHIAWIGAALVSIAAPSTAQTPVWDSAINCAALDLKRAELLADIPPPVPELAGTSEEAHISARVYLRIAAEALDCPAPEALNRMLQLASVGADHRMDVAARYDIPPEVMALGLASEAELTCALYINPELLAEARTAETNSTQPLCGW